MRTFFIAPVIVLCVLSIVGCSGPSRPVWASWHPNSWTHRGGADEAILLDVAGPVAVDVESFNGDVMIMANPKLSQAQVVVVREGVHGFRREKEAAASLVDISYTAEIVPGELGQMLQVRTSTTNAEPHYQRAHVYIQLPEIEGVKVRTSNGRVYAQGISGAVDIVTNHGDVRVMTNHPMTAPVTIVNRNGNIDYRVRGESRGVFDAETVNGVARVRVRHGKFTTLPPTTNSTVHGVLNEGENRITLRTVNGDIRIAVVHDPERVGAVIIG